MLTISQHWAAPVEGSANPLDADHPFPWFQVPLLKKIASLDTYPLPPKVDRTAVS